MAYRRSIDKLLVAQFFVIRKFPGQIVMQTFELINSRAQPHCIRTAPIGPIYKSDSRDSLFCASKTPANVLGQHGPSTNTLSLEL